MAQTWLMLAQETLTSSKSLRDCYSLSTGVTVQIILPEVYNNKFYSSKGWLLMIKKDWSVSLLHPFTRLQILLPPLKITFKCWDDTFTPNLDDVYKIFIHKFALSSTPSSTSSDCTLMVIHGELGKLAYCKPGDKAWSTIETWRGRYFDITYYKGKFYAVNCLGKILAFDLGCHNQIQIQSVATLPFMLFEKVYVVESAGSLLAITRHGVQLRSVEEGSEILTYGTYGFRVFEVNLGSNTCTEIKNLGDRAVFLGDNSSFSVEASEVLGYKPNRIYFTDDYFESYWYIKEQKMEKTMKMDMGVYNMEDGTIEPHYAGFSYSDITPPLWIEGEAEHKLILSRL